VIKKPPVFAERGFIVDNFYFIFYTQYRPRIGFKTTTRMRRDKSVLAKFMLKNRYREK